MKYSSRKYWLAGLFVFTLSAFARAEDPPSAALNLYIDFSQTKGFASYTHSENLKDDELQTAENVEFYRTRDISRRIAFTEGRVIGIPNIDKYPRSAGSWTKVFTSSTSLSTYLVYKLDRYINWINIDFQSNGESVNSFFSPIGNVDDVSESDVIIKDERMFIVCQTTGSKYLKILPDPDRGTKLTVYNTTAIPTGKYCMFYLDRFLVAGSSINPNRVFYSWSDQPLNFHPLDFFDIQSAKRDNVVTGIGEPFLNVLPIYTRYSTRELVGNTFPDGGTGGNISERVISDSVGCFHHWTIKNRKDGQYFFSEGVSGLQPGIYKFNGVGVQEITLPIRQWFLDTVQITTSIIPSAFVYEDKYCLIIATKGGVMNSDMVCLDERNVPSHYVFDDQYVDYFDVYQSSGFGLQNPVDAGGAMGMQVLSKINAIDRSLQVNRPIRMKVQTKDYDFGKQNAAKKKTIQRAYVDFQKNSGKFSLSAIYDFGRATTTWDIDMQTQYNSSTTLTVTLSSSNILNKLIFPYPSAANPAANKFNYVNFLITSTNAVNINSINVFATADPLP